MIEVGQLWQQKPECFGNLSSWIPTTGYVFDISVQPFIQILLRDVNRYNGYYLSMRDFSNYKLIQEAKKVNDLYVIKDKLYAFVLIDNVNTTLCEVQEPRSVNV